jgi:hypothetical protein
MAQVFRDMCRDAVRQRGTPGLIALWGRTLVDVAASAPPERFAEWSKKMTRKTIALLAIGLIVLAIPTGFTVNLLRYEAYTIPWNPSDVLYANVATNLMQRLMTLILFISPLVALAFFAMPFISVRMERGGNSLATITINRLSKLNLILMGLCVFVFGALAIYLLVEYWTYLPGIIDQHIPH